MGLMPHQYNGLCPAHPGQPHNGSGEPMGAYESGLTKREEFAKAAMAALIPLHYDRGKRYAESCAEDAVEYADALLERLAATEPQP